MNKLDALFSFHETALRIREQRQELLSANIANSDTPNYKARDFDFSAALNNAVTAQAGTASNNAQLSATALKHFGSLDPNSNSADQRPTLQYRSMVQGSVDGNTVDGDVERNQFTDNALHYEASLTILKSDIKDMLAVLQG